MSANFVKPERIFLKNHSSLNEAWVQNLIAEDPSILGLGELVLKDKERIQPRAGRLDLLLQDPETLRRYEVEVQLGATDESHIIRTIEYWDLERRRYPQYDHCAVIVAEDITSRFLNVISLFNSSVPLIAIQMQALKVGEHTTLFFTKVLDELSRGLVDEDEDAESAPTDRAYWEKKASKQTVHLVDELLDAAKELDPSLTLRYNKFYIGFGKNGQAFNFSIFRPRKSTVNLEVKLPRSDELDKKIDETGLETLEYSSRWGYYRLALKPEDIKEKRDVVKDLMLQAYNLRSQ
jgi:predicted transport protein